MARNTHRRRGGKKLQPEHAQKISFNVTHLDNLGQGVDKSGDYIRFIAKTLPGETGTARVMKTRKNVQIARLDTLEAEAGNRIPSECPHYQSCPGCHYLHTDYPSELAYKQSAMQRYLHKLDVTEEQIEVVSAPQRSGYRNRMQLHYRHKYLGMIDSQTDQVVEIPDCLVLRDELKPTLQQLYSDKSWSKTRSGNGHCEIYLKNGEPSIAWDEDYAHGGFTQVNEAMNQVLCDSVKAQLDGFAYDSLLDLFAGNGNLSNPLVDGRDVKRLMVDYSADNSHDDFMQMNLFDEEALARFKRRQKQIEYDVLLIDPPRKGFPALAEWVQAVKPKKLIYVSCNPQSLAQDLQQLQGKFTLSTVMLLDMFPGTHHFESLVTVDFKRYK